ncbi:putative necrosis-inducing factor-domain-containing protein [Bipolaris maydis]|nr:putative necrosis-inducing factor-domain-containing protein [Bipolaris maydis]
MGLDACLDEKPSFEITTRNSQLLFQQLPPLLRADTQPFKMRFSASVIVASLAATAVAAPTSPAPENVLKKRNNFCGATTFINNSSGGSPWITDCQTMFDRIAGDGTWVVEPQQKRIASWGTCEFGARSVNNVITTIGNEDVRDLTRDSIARFAWQGRVGASGIVDCGTSGSVKVWWGLYHT